MQTFPINAQNFPLAEGDAGVAFTIEKMSELVETGKASAPVRACALEILNRARVRAFDPTGAARAIYEWVRRSIVFTPDPIAKEGVQTAEWTLHFRRGDCDCISVLICSLLESIGLRCRLMTVAADPRDPEQFSHVYPEVLVAGKWVAVDAARRHPAFARSPARYFRKRVWSVDSGEWRDLAMNGLGIMPPINVTAAAHHATRLPQFYAAPAPRRSYFRRRLRGLGQDWGEIGQAIQAGTAGAANIIAAARATPYNLYPTTYVPSSGAGAGPQIRFNQPPPVAGNILGFTPNELLVGLLLIGGVVIATQR